MTHEEHAAKIEHDYHSARVSPYSLVAAIAATRRQAVNEALASLEAWVGRAGNPGEYEGACCELCDTIGAELRRRRKELAK